MTTSSQTIYQYFPDFSENQRKKIDLLESLYADWNSKINLISRKDIEFLYLKHVLHSLGIAKIVEFLPEAKVLDMGTGGGFPGIPLAILFPNTWFHLLDSIEKKIRVVQNIARELNLLNVTAEHKRVEKVKGHYDFAVSRAVTDISSQYSWIKDKINETSKHKIPNGLLCLKGGELDEELKSLTRPYSIYSLSNYFKEDYFETKKLIHVEVSK